MFTGIGHDILQTVMEGKSPLCAIEKRIANGKMMAFNISKAYGFLPPSASIQEFMDDLHGFWREKFLAQTGAETGGEEPLIC